MCSLSLILLIGGYKMSNNSQITSGRKIVLTDNKIIIVDKDETKSYYRKNINNFTVKSNTYSNVNAVSIVMSLDNDPNKTTLLQFSGLELADCMSDAESFISFFRNYVPDKQVE
jgi:phage gp45-like